MLPARTILIGLIAGLMSLLSLFSSEVFPADGSAVPLMNKALDGTDKDALVLKVTYPPGASTPIHRHDADVFVYVLEGSITMQVTGGEPVTLGPGEMFYESPDDVHAVSKNASDVQPAEFLVFLVKGKDKPATTLVQ